MPTLLRDYETRSTANLKKVGAWQYARDPSTEVLCCAFCVDDSIVKIWLPGDPIPPEFITAANNPDWVVSAFNDNFERQVENHLLGPKYGWPLTPVERHRCSQAAALALALPATLQGVAEALGLAQQKDQTGHVNMLALCKPRKARKDEDPTGTYWHTDPERYKRLYAYCVQDVEVERALHALIGSLPPDEQKLWELDARINDRGIYLDSDLIRGAIKIGEAATKAIDTELVALTEGAVASVGQTERLIAWLAANGCKVKDVQKETIRHALTRTDLSQTARRVMELRAEGAHAAVKKYQTMARWRSDDGRLHGAFRYHGASTGRWTSLGVQLQNLKKPSLADTQGAIDAIRAGDLAKAKAFHSSPMEVAGDIVRATVIAAPGHTLFMGDFNAIESRVLAWISFDQPKLDLWAKFDRTGDPADDPYRILGLRFGVTGDKIRERGKTGDLAFGYMGGVGAYRKFSPNDPATDDTIKGYQKAWRSAHPGTVLFWGQINKAAVMAVRYPGQVHEANSRISFRCDDTFLRMKLPSGRELSYPFPRLILTERNNFAVVFKDNAEGKWVDCRHGLGAYGGTWTENAVSAAARDIFATAMLRLEAAGYRIVLHAHDGVVAEAPDGFGSPDEVNRIMTATPGQGL